ncbi:MULTISPECIES: 16S rRNA (guanine(966)-N(2))-methyltransferase RsmD [Microbacterium]|uniref:16S rRNA (guanine(966)-N(2))-methyltransferase RsmD n=1 Tax=Microbacterium TaxID=33882 RepID=UPI00217DA4B3|nr:MULTISPECIES: 16S rRNA (guanine(966)-N(2))-methyltransferase RsmD [Microbacterium]UWF78444.1 16S rRNA (guanine(966)-N(2))-methyltransferase RsmD [Microbacterium neungamense]WCM56620.1 16S rRNA (guanine(966)-N(2))-methyltransferase RsmD [Microbacterium sp. EF45047]
MTRIIAGAARGVRLDVPGAGTRPTSDRVRESLFGALESMDAVHGARVLDLYAGTGALGLEAWSRGAASVDLVERSRPAALVVKRNAAAVAKSMGVGRAAQVHQATVRGFLQRGLGAYDLVFTDPPYDLDDAAMTGDLVALAPLLSAHAVVVIERARRSSAPDVAAAGLEIVREKSYGDTAVWWAVPVA